MNPSLAAQEIKKAQTFREQFIDPVKMRHIMRFYRAQYPDNMIPKNLIFSTQRGMLPYIYFKNPTIKVKTRSSKMEVRLAEPLIQSLVELLIEKLQLKHKIRACAVDNGLVGTSVIKLLTTKSGSLPHSIQVNEKHSYTGMNSKSKLPVVEPVFASNFVVPNGTTRHYGNTLDVPWCAQKIIMRKKDALKEDKFSKKAVMEAPSVEPAFDDDFFPGKSNADDKTDPIAKASSFIQKWFKKGNNRSKLDRGKREEEKLEHMVVYEVWEADDGRLSWISCDSENEEVVKLGETNFNIDKLPLRSLPYIFSNYNSDPRYFWGVADAAVVYPQQMEAAFFRTHISYLIRLLSVVFGYDTGKVDAKDVQRLLSDEPMAAIPVQGSPSDAIAQYNISIPNEIPQLIKIGEDDVQELLGYSENMAGRYHSGRRTAAEALTVRTGAQSRVDDKRSLMADMIVETIRYTMEIVFDTWTDDVVLPFRTPGSNEISLVQFKWKDLKADYTFELGFEDALPDSKIERSQNAQLVASMLGSIEGIDHTELIDYVLRQIGADIDVDSLRINPQVKNYLDVIEEVRNANVQPTMPQVQ